MGKNRAETLRAYKARRDASNAARRKWPPGAPVQIDGDAAQARLRLVSSERLMDLVADLVERRAGYVRA